MKKLLLFCLTVLFATVISGQSFTTQISIDDEIRQSIFPKEFRQNNTARPELEPFHTIKNSDDTKVVVDSVIEDMGYIRNKLIRTYNGSGMITEELFLQEYNDIWNNDKKIYTPIIIPMIR